MGNRPPPAVFAAAVVIALAVTSSPAAADATTKGAVVSPRPGQALHTNVVTIRLRSDARRVRLNGMRIGSQFGPRRKGVRTLRASVSHGLRRGNNTIRFRRDGERRTVSFTLRRSGGLVGAGIDGRAATDGRIDLRGRVQGHAPGLRWKMLDAPKGASEEVGSPAGNTASFRATMPGSYTFALGAGAQSQDRVTVAAVARNLLVPVDTMADSKGIPGIQVGQTFYPRQGPTDFDVQLQVLVLKRATLERVSNDTYPDASQLPAAISKLNSTNLAIVSDLGPKRTGGLPALLARIGVAQVDYPSGTGRVFSAIGVPGMKPGEAHVLFNPGQSSGGRLRGYLTPDQYNNYRFVRPERVPFQEGGSEGDPCGVGDPAPACKANVGFRLNVYDAYTREARPGDNRVYNTGGANLTAQQQTAEVNRLATDLSKVAPGDTAVLLSVGLRAAGQDTYPAHIGTAVDESAMANLALQIRSVGGSPDAFNRAALARGPAAGMGTTYALVGWKGAVEGEGAEAAIGVDGAGAAPIVSGVWQPDLQSQYRPASVQAIAAQPAALTSLVLQQPSGTWPLDGNADAQKALAYLGSKDKRLGSDPRSAYWIQDFDASDWRDIARVIGSIRAPSDEGFSRADFRSAKIELVQELEWVGNVRSYIDKISTPFQDNSGVAWADAHTIADKVYKALNPPQVAIQFGIGQLFSILLKMAGPFTGGATTVMAASLDLGTWIFGASRAGSPTTNDLDVKADDLANQIERQAKGTQATMDRMGDVIVNDYAKLQSAGTNALCNPSDPSCPAGWAFTRDDRDEASAAIQRGIERTAYDRLFPLGYRTYELRNDTSNQLPVFRSAAPDIGNYRCRNYRPWYLAPDKALVSAVSAGILEPRTGNMNYTTYVFAQAAGANDHEGTFPPPAMLHRMFDPLPPNATDPDQGGLGMSRLGFVRDHDTTFWEGDQGSEESHCDWEFPSQ